MWRWISAGAAGGRGRIRSKLAGVEAADEAAQASESARSRRRTAQSCCPTKYKQFPQEHSGRHRHSRRTAHARARCCWPNQIIRTCRCVAAAKSISIMKPDDLALKRSLAAQITEIEKERPKPIPRGDGGHRRRLSLHARRSRRRAGAGKGCQARSHRGQLSVPRSGPLPGAAIVLPAIAAMPKAADRRWSPASSR